MKRLFALIIMLLTASQLCASIAVLPYRDRAYDKRISGKEYGKMVALGIRLMKNIDVLSPEEAEIGMKQLGINPEGSVDADALEAFGKKYNLSYILLGTLSKKKGAFAFDNVLYSVRDRQLLSRNSNSSGSIYELVQLEVRETLISFESRKKGSAKNQADIVFMIDTSYNTSSEWESVRGAISDFTSGMIGELNVDTRVYLSPYSERKSYEQVTVHHNSISEVRDTLSKMNTGGAADTGKFTSLLNYSIKNIRWRSDASKEIYIINNSKLDGIFVPERYAAEAKRRGIHINVISAGKVSGEFSGIERLAALTGGSAFSVSYHRKVFDKSGGRHELYLQRGRIFHTIASYPGWRGGILKSLNNNPKYVKPPESLDEVFHTRNDLTPDRLVETFSEFTGLTVIQKELLQNNIEDLLLSMKVSLSDSSGSSFLGRVLVSDGKVSFWVKVRDRQIMNVFERQWRNGFLLKTGFNIRKSLSDPYGIELIPVTADIGSDYVPALAETTLTDIVKNSDFFITRGIGSPPVWFIDVKIENFERSDIRKDIRD